MAEQKMVKPQVGRPYPAGPDVGRDVRYRAWWESMKSWAVGLQGGTVSGTDVVDAMAKIEMEVS